MIISTFLITMLSQNIKKQVCVIYFYNNNYAIIIYILTVAVIDDDYDLNVINLLIDN